MRLIIGYFVFVAVAGVGTQANAAEGEASAPTVEQAGTAVAGL